MTKGNACGNCGKTLVTDECAFCGWKRGDNTAAGDAPRMPTLADALNVIAGQIEQYRGERPAGMPTDPQAAARWMHEKVIEKHQPEEAPRLVMTPQGKDTVQAWRWPYMTRIKIQTRQFLKLSPDFQRYIIAAKEDGIPWRGDDETIFRKVVDETLRMQQLGLAEYRKLAGRTMRILQDNLKTTEAA